MFFHACDKLQFISFVKVCISPIFLIHKRRISSGAYSLFPGLGLFVMILPTFFPRYAFPRLIFPPIPDWIKRRLPSFLVPAMGVRISKFTAGSGTSDYAFRIRFQVSQYLSSGMSSGYLSEASLSSGYSRKLPQSSSDSDFGQVMTTNQRLCLL